MDTEKKAKLNTNSYINILAIKKISVFEKVPCRLSNSVIVSIAHHTKRAHHKRCKQGSTWRSGKWTGLPLSSKHL